jgi:hypothetical protein
MCWHTQSSRSRSSFWLVRGSVWLADDGRGPGAAAGREEGIVGKASPGSKAPAAGASAVTPARRKVYEPRESSTVYH